MLDYLGKAWLTQPLSLGEIRKRLNCKDSYIFDVKELIVGVIDYPTKQGDSNMLIAVSVSWGDKDEVSKIRLFSTLSIINEKDRENAENKAFFFILDKIDPTKSKELQQAMLMEKEKKCPFCRKQHEIESSTISTNKDDE